MKHLLVIATLALGACSSLAPTASVRAVYDLGPATAVASGGDPSWRIADVAAPPWLTTDGIAYRLLFQQAQRLEHYRDSAWAAPPPALLTQRLRERVPATPACAGQPAALLAVNLDEFEQVFASPTSSQAVLRVHATIWPAGTTTQPRQQHWRLERPAGGDATGAVRGLAQAVDDWLPLLSRWLEASCKS